MVLSMILRLFSSSLKAYWFIFYAVALSVLIYASFYVFYLPTSEHVLDVHLKYNTQCDPKEQQLCSFPSANVLLHVTPKASKDGFRVLTRGQGYDITLELEMPLSDSNKNLGMFLIQLDLLKKDNTMIESHSRSALLKFQSNLLSTLNTVFYVLPLLTGFKDEQQRLVVPLVENFIDDSYKPMNSVNITIHSKRIQIYSAKLRFKAIFTGLRYYMHNWPMTFSLVGFASVLCMVTLVLLYRFLKSLGTSESVRSHVATTIENYGDLSESSGDEDVDVEVVESGDLKDGSSSSGHEGNEENESGVRQRRTTGRNENETSHLESLFNI